MEKDKKYNSKRKEAVVETIGYDIDAREKNDYITCVNEDLDRIFDFGYDYGRVTRYNASAALYEISLIATLSVLLLSFLVVILFFH
ncbi:hypothetical protein UFOVP671_46 [uncultured Caudovirales phage]|uniref:Uncharacterized protein n=1 Tax=uncultured Caudovirales phage TaxID=2100421 RepID=A0A6J5NLK2_9CAUD|nr:hypothetical protein UFOVP671_46 [uncultured Caudovirales phage]